MAKRNSLILTLLLFCGMAQASRPVTNDALLAGDCRRSMSSLTAWQAALCLMSKDNKDSNDRKRIRELLRAEASKGNAAAAYQLGLYYLSAGSPESARRAFTTARKDGSLLAQPQLDALSRRGKPDEQRETRARIRRAVVSGDIRKLENLIGDGEPATSQDTPEPLLELAIQAGHEKTAVWLIDHRLYDRRAAVTYLSQAIRAREDRVAARLIASMGSKAFAQPLPNGDSLLFMALRHDSPGVVRDLIRAGANPLSTDTDGRTAIRYAFDKHDEELARQFAESGHPPDRLHEATLKELTRKPDSPYYRRPLILVAAESFDNSLVERLVATGGDPWHAGADGASALEIMYLRGNARLARKLIEQAAPPVPAKKLISLTIRNDDPETLALLIRLGRYRKNDYPHVDTSPLWQAANAGSEVCKQLITWQGMDARTDADGKNILMHALERHNFEMAADLIRAGFPLAARDHLGRTAHWYAANEGASEVLATLARKVDLINEGDMNGHTPLLRAVDNGDLATVRVALTANVQIDRPSNAGNTALMLAAAGKPEIVDLLLHRNADYKLRNANSLTALMISARDGCDTCRKLLVSAGANPKRKDSRGRSALDMMHGR
jgi:ankyrin repeat protein